MKILHVVQGYSPAIGGTEYLIQKISEQLVSEHQDQVTVFTTTAYNCDLFWRRDQPQLPAGEELIAGVKVQRFPVFNRFGSLRRLLAGASFYARLPYNDRLRTLYNGPIIPSMPDMIAAFDADVIAGSSFPLMHMYYMLQGGAKSQTPVVLHGGIHTADTFGFDRQMMYEAIHQANSYIANTAFERDYLVSKGIPAEKITVIGVGVDIAPFTAANGRTIRDRFGWNDAPILAFVGQQVAYKGLDIIMEAMPQVWRSSPEACLLIAGAKTEYSAKIKKWVGEQPLSLQNRVAIIDNFTEAEKPDIFTACDVLLLPSAHESFGIVFLEAWAAKKPVIGLQAGCMTSVVDQGHDGLLIENRSASNLVQAITLLLQQPQLRRRLGEAGFRKVQQHYRWDVVARKFRQVYMDVLKVRP